MWLPDGPSRDFQETSGLSMNLSHGDSIDVLYPHAGMESIWLSVPIGRGKYVICRASLFVQIGGSLG